MLNVFGRGLSRLHHRRPPPPHLQNHPPTPRSLSIIHSGTHHLLQWDCILLCAKWTSRVLTTQWPQRALKYNPGLSGKMKKASGGGGGQQAEMRAGVGHKDPQLCSWDNESEKEQSSNGISDHLVKTEEEEKKSRETSGTSGWTWRKRQHNCRLEREVFSGSESLSSGIDQTHRVVGKNPFCFPATAVACLPLLQQEKFEAWICIPAPSDVSESKSNVHGPHTHKKKSSRTTPPQKRREEHNNIIKYLSVEAACCGSTHLKVRDLKPKRDHFKCTSEPIYLFISK